jgi:hypothetical protein
MYSLIYASSASSVFTAEDLQRLSEVSAENNQRDGITGALISKEGTFMQVLEGDPSAVLATFARISLDSRLSRHHAAAPGHSRASISRLVNVGGNDHRHER